MKKTIGLTAVLFMGVLTLSGCGDTSKDGVIVTDTNTGKQYLLQHNIGNTYFIQERQQLISGKDTTYVFR